MDAVVLDVRSIYDISRRNIYEFRGKLKVTRTFRLFRLVAKCYSTAIPAAVHVRNETLGSDSDCSLN